MALSTLVKNSLNRLLAVGNLQIRSLTAEKGEKKRLFFLKEDGYFDQPAFRTLLSFQTADPSHIFSCLAAYKDRFNTFNEEANNNVGFQFKNSYFRSPDCEVYYAIIRKYNPRLIVEIGSGNSTKIARQAIMDGKLNTRIICIDPHPRVEVANLADNWHPSRVERIPIEFFGQLQEGDILFVDSSHELLQGNDVCYIYGTILPVLKPGVLIHIHDIFLPYDYPYELIKMAGTTWTEQYVVQAMLQFGSTFEVIWPGHFLQKTRSDFFSYFPHNKGELAQSLWLRAR